MYTCDLCEKAFPSKNALSFHLREVHGSLCPPSSVGRKLRRCEICCKEVSYSNFRKHQRVVHHIIPERRRIAEDDSYNNVENCAGEVTSADYFKTSNRICVRDSAKVIMCKVCGKGISRSNIRKHEKLMHNIYVPYGRTASETKIMYFSGDQKFSLKSINTKFSNEKIEAKNVPNEMLEKSRINDKINEFENLQSRKFRTCNLCKKDISASNFRKHEKIAHGIKIIREKLPIFCEFICDICGEKFAERKKMINHFKKKHDIESDARNTTSKDSSFDHQKICLPTDYEYKFTQKIETEDKYFVVFKFFVRDESSLNEWIKKYEQLNYTCLRIGGGIPKFKNEFVVRKVVYRCIRNSKPRKNVRPREKHTGCPFRMFIRLVKSKKIEYDELMAVVTLRHRHNHLLDELTWMKFQNPSRSVYEEFHNLFEKGFSPVEALHLFKQKFISNQEQNHDGQLPYKIEIPTLRWVYYQFSKTAATFKTVSKDEKI